MGKIVELPRELEWSPKTAWLGKVKGTRLWARVEQNLFDDNFIWYAGDGGAAVGHGIAASLEAGQEAAQRALEATVVYFQPAVLQEEAI